MSSLRERAGTRERDLDLLGFEIEEIEALGPSEAERGSLLAERGRLRGIDSLLAAAGGGAEAISPDGDGGAALLLAEAGGSPRAWLASTPRSTSWPPGWLPCG